MISTLLSVASTHTLSVTQIFGITVSPAAGGTVVLADLADAGATPLDLNDPTGISGTFAVLTLADATAVTVDLPGTRLTNGLTVAYTSTTYATVHTNAVI